MNYRVVLIPALSLIFSKSLFGAAVPAPSSSAGVVEREIEKEYESKPIEPRKPIPLIEVDVPKKQLHLARGEKIAVKSIVVEGNTVFSEKELHEAVQDYFGRNLTMEDIENLCLAVQRLYVEKGYFVARVYPPVQKLSKCQLKLQVLEGYLGEITVVGNKHYKESFIRSYFTHLQNEPLNYDQFLKAVILLNENSDLTVGAVFDKGKEFGEVNLIIRVEDKEPFHVYADYNNYGSHKNTLQRTGARIDYGNLVVNGDTLTLIEVVGLPASHLYFTDALYNIPIGHRGIDLTLSYLYSAFKVQSFHPLHLRGTSQIASLKMDFAMDRSRALNYDLFWGFDYKNIKNFTLGRINSNDRLRILSAGIDLDYVDGLSGRNLFNARAYVGIPNILDGLKSVDRMSSRKGAGGQFTLFNVDYKRLQRVFKNGYVFLNFSGQYALDKLTLPEQFYIGGIDTVRGYPLAVVLGDHGYYANLELRVPPFGNKRVPFLKKKKWSDILQFVGFVDNGQVYFIGGSAKHENGHAALLSAGAGVRLIDIYRFNANFDVGFPILKKHASSNTILYFKVSLNLM